MYIRVRKKVKLKDLWISQLIRIAFILLFVLMAFTPAQLYIPADPYNHLFFEEQDFSLDVKKQQELFLRPYYNNLNDSWAGNFLLTVRSDFFYNDNAPNLENTSDKWIGKGFSFFSSMKLSYINKILLFSIEPFIFHNQNKGYDEPWRMDKYSRLNDNMAHSDAPYRKSGFREGQIYLHYQGFGFGYSNANMWWGPGIHTSLNMTNNTTGFPHLMIGTLKEQRYKQFGFQLRYIFAEMDERNITEPYFTALLASMSWHSDPTITLGFSRTYLTGGRRTQEKISRWEAMTIPFESLFLSSKIIDPEDPESSLDIWDQTLVGYLLLSFPEAKLKLFIEYGRNDHAWDTRDFVRQPDHTSASVIGFRKYGFFGADKFVAGIEYANIIKTKFWTKRKYADWYDRWAYDYSSFDGRHWAAHSGPDSDDLYFYVGYISKNLSIIPSFNYERHGVIDNSLPELPTETWDDEIVKSNNPYIWPEAKFEYRLDVRYKYKGFNLNMYYEKEKIVNLEFREKERKANIFWFGVDYIFDKNFFKNAYHSLTEKFSRH